MPIIVDKDVIRMEIMEALREELLLMNQKISEFISEEYGEEISTQDTRAMVIFYFGTIFLKFIESTMEQHTYTAITSIKKVL